MLSEKTFNCIEGLLFVSFEKKLDHVFVFFVFSHSIFMTTYLENVFVFVLGFFYFTGLCGSGLAKAQQRTFEVGGGALDFALVKKLM